MTKNQISDGLRILTDRKHNVNVLWKLPVAKMTAITLLTWGEKDQDVTMATV